MLYVKDGHLTHCYNFAGLEKYVITSTQPVTSGEHQVRMEFAYEGGGLGKGEPSPSTLTARALVRARSKEHCRWSSPLMRHLILGSSAVHP